MPGWARLKFLPLSVRVGGGPQQVGLQHPPEYKNHIWSQIL